MDARGDKLQIDGESHVQPQGKTGLDSHFFRMIVMLNLSQSMFEMMGGLKMGVNETPPCCGGSTISKASRDGTKLRWLARELTTKGDGLVIE